MNEKVNIKNYVLLIRIRESIWRKKVEYEKKSNNPILSSKETIRLIRKSEYKHKRYQQITGKLKQFENQLNLSPEDKMCLKHYGMTAMEVKKEKGNDKKEWSRNLEILHKIFMRECY